MLSGAMAMCVPVCAEDEELRGSLEHPCTDQIG